MSSNIKIPKKLIEVALPLDDINAAAQIENTKRYGKPSSIHLWWSPKVLSAARAVLFAQMVNDPADVLPGDRRTKVFKEAVTAERERLFQIIRELVLWKNNNNEVVLNKAREEIHNSWRHICELNKNHPDAVELFNPDKLPAFHDPFAGGGAIPLEAQRLGLEAYATDLNPVAVMINKAMIEIPPKFAGRAPVGPIPEDEKQTKLAQEWPGATGLAEDVRRYGQWMREEAFKRIGHLYPKVKITAEMATERHDLKELVGNELSVIAWIWARTVKSPNPAFSHVDVPLASKFALSTKAGKEAWVEPIVEGDGYRFVVRVGKSPEDARGGTKLSRANFSCIVSGTPISGDYIKAEGMADRMGAKLIAIVVEGSRGRVYLSPTIEHEQICQQAKPIWKPEGKIAKRMTGGNCTPYGLTSWGDLFTPRQLVTMTTLSDLVQETRAKVIADATVAGMNHNNLGINDGGTGAIAYGDAVAVYLSIGINKFSDLFNCLVRWEPVAQCPRQLFARQAIPMMWEFAEGNAFGESSGSWIVTLKGVANAIDSLFLHVGSNKIHSGVSFQVNTEHYDTPQNSVISTDPPYFDMVGYADLADFFYVWLRRSLRFLFPDILATMAVPKEEELVATPYRHGSKIKAEQFFLNGMGRALDNIAKKSHPSFPVTIYYAFKASETDDSGTGNTGWETFLGALLGAGFSLVGSWPLRTEKKNRQNAQNTNSLASSILLVCQKRSVNADIISRRQFQRELREEIPEALETMIGGETGQTPIAPVDLAQAAIGPGMAIFSKYRAVLNQDGSPMSIHDALILINREITDYLSPDSGNFDNDTLFCSAWFDQYGWSAGSFGEADTLSRAKGTSVDGVKKSGVIESGGGKVKLMKWEDYPDDWDPKTDHRMPVWETLHHMVRALNRKGEGEAGVLLARMPDKSEHIRQLAYHLYTLCERKKWAEEARAYNELITSWHGIVSSSHEVGHKGTQNDMFE